MKLVNVHRVLKFKQSDCLKRYIDFNTDKRKYAANSFEKNLFKLINNCLIMLKILKTMQASQDLFHKKFFSKGLVTIYEIKPVLTLDKPIY